MPSSPLPNVLRRLALALVLGACQDALAPATPTPRAARLDEGAAPDSALAAPTPAGLPTGLAARATIGPEGGELTSADGRLVVTVPAGAVDTATEFAVQPIERTAGGGVGAGYRLSPHGTPFAKPVRLTFHYDSATTRGTAASLLRVAAQDSVGRWWMYPIAERDTAAGTVSVDAPHFSDWSLVAGAQLLPHEATVNVGKTLDLRVQVCEAEAPDGSAADSLLAPVAYACHDAPLVDVATSAWSVNGIAGGSAAAGTATPTPDGATYAAPTQVPPQNPVAVSVDYGALAAAGATTLVATVTVVDPAAACAYLRDVDTWDGGFRTSYALTATMKGRKDYTSMRYYADVQAHLTRLSAGPNGVTWQGPITGYLDVDASIVLVSGQKEYRNTITAQGAPLAEPMMSEPSRASLSVNLRDCTYTVAFTGSAAAKIAYYGEPVRDGEAGVGSVRAAPRPIAGRTALSGGGSFPAHSALWAMMNRGDGYFFSTFESDPILGGFVDEDGAGTASVSWSFAPSAAPAPSAGVRTPAAAVARR